MSEHAKFSPSSAKRWISCTGSVALASNFPPSPDSAASLRGTFLHEVAAGALTRLLDEIRTGQSVLFPAALDADQKEKRAITAARFFMMDTAGRTPGKYAAEELDRVGLLPTEDQTIDALREYIAYCHTHILNNQEDIATGIAEVRMEQRVFPVKEFESVLWGTADFILHNSRTAALVVADLKTGNYDVPAVDNPQLLIYALGASRLFGAPASVTVAISQKGDTLEWVPTPREFRNFLVQLRHAVTEAESATRKLVAGDHCFFCPAKPACPEYEKRGLALVQADFGTPDTGFRSTELRTVGPDKAAEILEAIEFFTGWAEQAKEILAQRMRGGLEIPGFKLIESAKRRAWIDEKTAIRYFADRPDAFNPPKLRTVTQIMKEFGAEAVPDSLWTQPKGEPRVVPESKRGKPWTEDSDLSEFSNEEGK